MFKIHTHRLSPTSIPLIVGIVAAIFASSVIWLLEEYQLQQRRATALVTASNFADLMQRNIDNASIATHALAALVRQGNGSVSHFEKVGSEMLPLYPGISSLFLVPRGIVKSAVPLSGNEKILGFDLLHDPVQKKEALLARDSGTLTLAGPLELIEGGVGLVGRLPVFLKDATGKTHFWGFTTAVLRIPEVLQAAGMSKLVEQGYAYELWRIRPDEGTRQTVAASSSAPLVHSVTRTFLVPNATWNLSIEPVKGWLNPISLAIETTLGFLFTMLLAYSSKLMVESRLHETELEQEIARRTAEIRAREAELTRALSVGRIGSWVVDLAGNVVSVSPETNRILGLNARPPVNYKELLRLDYAEEKEVLEQSWQGLDLPLTPI